MEPRNVQNPKFHCRVRTVRQTKHINIHMNVTPRPSTRFHTFPFPLQHFVRIFVPLTHFIVIASTNKLIWNFRETKYVQRPMTYYYYYYYYMLIPSVFEPWPSPSPGFRDKFLRGEDGSWFTVTVLLTCITIHIRIQTGTSAQQSIFITI